ncbi:MAG: Type 1 glutamine amidotransferase-like domain-containing protein [Eubacteriales bacterium]|nr:Type 1 glutamine amidotransferase-like domain-containing protein [Eubacteriales bacterium]
MNARLLGFFSGFPTRHFTDSIADVLNRKLNVRDSLIFVSGWPDDSEQNDNDSHGMHRMFVERNMPFANHYVIDRRTDADEAVKLIRKASCIFLMGGNATLQFKLMCEKGIVDEIRQSSAVILGVSAGAMNMGSPTVDIYESPVPYEGLGFANITVKAHYPLDDELLQPLRQVSMEYPVCLMTDESAIFITKDMITSTGQIYRLVRGDIAPLTQQQLEQMRKR